MHGIPGPRKHPNTAPHDVGDPGKTEKSPSMHVASESILCIEGILMNACCFHIKHKHDSQCMLLSY